MPLNKSTVKKQKPLQLDCTSLLNHVSLVQNSIPQIQNTQQWKDYKYSSHQQRRRPRNRNIPSLQMVALTRGILPRTTTYASSSSVEWYILVASTPFAISAQLVPVPKTRDSIVEPDVIQCTPISIWTCAENGGVNGNANGDSVDGGDDCDRGGTANVNTSDTGSNLEILNCNPMILVQEPRPRQTDDTCVERDVKYSTPGSGKSLSVSVVLGTTKSRVLCVQLSIFSYVGISGREEGRYVLSRAVESGNQSLGRGGILEPLPIDSDETIRRKIAEASTSSTRSNSNSNNHSSMSLSSSHNNDGHSVTSGTATAGSRDTNKDVQKWIPFRPSGGVTCLSPLYKDHNTATATTTPSGDPKIGCNSSFTWITYGDGTLVRLPRWALFPLLEDDYYDDVDNDFDHRIQIGGGIKDRLVKAMVIINPQHSAASSSSAEDRPTIIPLPRFFPTLMSQPLASGVSSIPSLAPNSVKHFDEDSDFFSNGNSFGNPETGDYEFYEAVSFNDGKAASINNSISPPTLSFYTNEDQLFSKTHNKSVDENGEISAVQSIIRGGSTIIGGTAAIAKGVLGGVMGAVLGKSKQTEEEAMKGMEIVSEDYGYSTTSISSSTIFPSIHEDAVKLPLGTATFDSPRLIVNASIDPIDGLLMACADNLGRVQLIDLSTKQVIRIWKGFREATCHWIQFPFQFDTGAQIVKYLTIHCRERKVVEIYRMRHGPRVGKYATASDAQIVQCVVALKADESYTKCFILQTNNGTKRYIAKELMVHDDELNKVVLESSPNVNKRKDKNEQYLANHQSLSEGTTSIQLQLLKQQLASESAVPSDLDTVYAALTHITAISDLSRAIDLLAVAAHLENMGVEDSSFHVEVISHAREQLKVAMSDEIIASSNNPLLEELRSKIEFHSKLIESYDILHRFEIGCFSDNDCEGVDTNLRSTWITEALSWIETAVEVRGCIDADLLRKDNSNLSFSVFAKGLTILQDGWGSSSGRNNDGNPALYLCDSTRDRKNILLHIFQPLTKDIFVFKTTQQIFEKMGIHKDHDRLLQYYGEWFISLPKAIIEKECLGIWNPTVRWLHDIVQQSVEIMLRNKKEEKGTILLLPLHQFCVEAVDLPRAFLLASVCREAIQAATKQLEDKTYGKVSCESLVKPWEELLRKLRVCLLISLRLHNKALGTLPITVSNVDNGLFSVYEWIARDLLSFSHNQIEIAALELAIASSPIAFCPSSASGDQTSRWKMVQKSCKVQALCCPKDEDQPGPLLFFLKHYSNSRKLAAHRALLLAKNWGREPESLELLRDALSSLQNIGRDEQYYSFLLATTLLEIWQIHIRPIYRALLFGFDEVHELCEEVIAPLCIDPIWFQNLNKLSMKIIALLLSTADSETYEELDEVSTKKSEDSTLWPRLVEDITIEGLTRRAMTLDATSLEAHNAIICAIKLNDDLSLLPMCVNSFDTLFLRQAFSMPFSRTYTANEYQLTFMEIVTRRQGEVAEGTVNREHLDDIVLLGRNWGMDKGHVLTQFLLVMYELGKDDHVEDLFNSVTRLLDVDMFLDHGIAIVCVRLSTALSILKKAKQCRGILAMLDADTCEWVREQARTTRAQKPDIVAINEEGSLISLDNTQALILRMKRMSSVNRIDAYALSVMCETLLKAVDYLET